MLSRSANNVYWMQRYRERAENYARMIEVNHILSIDLPESEIQWQPMLETSSTIEDYKKYYKEINDNNIINFLTFNPSNSNSILGCVSRARENARSVKEIITSEMWHEINTLYLFLLDEASQGFCPRDPYSFYSRVKRQSQLFTGIADTTMSHGKAWHFGRIGYLLERADMTSRMLDFKYFILLPSVEHVGTPYDDVQWCALLKSVSAFEMYRKKYQHIIPTNIVEFLLLDNDFPRSVYSCLKRVKDSLQAIKSESANPRAIIPLDLITALIERFEELNGETILKFGLHEFLDEVQVKIIEIDKSIHEAFFNSVIASEAIIQSGRGSSSSSG